MTPQEKAKEIYCHYTDALNIRDLQTTANPFAKQCALICMKEIIEALYEYDEITEKYLKEEFGTDYFSTVLQNMDSDFRYWDQVKQEIEKL